MDRNLFLHFVLGFLIRLGFIFYGIVQDSISEVHYTDIDYKVFTDAARNIIEGNSPYNTATYRYPPFIAILMIPNILIDPCFGKVLLSLSDLLVFYLLYRILLLDGNSNQKSIKFALFWLYNPLSIVISTRGNADSVAAVFVISNLFMFKKQNYFFAGLLYGIAVHIRLYPIVFSLPLYISIKNSHSNKFLKTFFPNKSRLILVNSCLVSLLSLTGICYWFYGYDFIYQSLLFHITRIDIRHNYSVYFYLNYLNFGLESSIVNKISVILPILILLLVLSFKYGNVKDLAFCEMSMAFVLVMFNSVITCQYFVWYLSLLPLSLPLLNCPWKELFLVSNFWFASQVAWLLPAYLLEFKSLDSFLYIWIQCLVFFWANVVVLTSMVRNYDRKIKSS